MKNIQLKSSNRMTINTIAGANSSTRTPIPILGGIVAKLPPQLQQAVQLSPCTGGGVHRWLFSTALKLHQHLKPEEIFVTLAHGSEKCGRPVPDREIRNAIVNSAKIGGTSNLSTPLGKIGSRDPSKIKESWPTPDSDVIQDILSKGGNLNMLASGSKYTGHFDPEPAIDLLFPGNPFLCCGTQTFQFDTRLRQQWRGRLVLRQA